MLLRKNGGNIVIQTLDLEFNEWCEQLLTDGMDPISFLQILNQCSFIWTACRKKCAQLCLQHGNKEMADKIIMNENGETI